MAYKISYKVVSEQGEQLKNIAKDMDNYTSQLQQIISKLGNDELLQSVRGDLNKFLKQLEEEKTILNLAGQVITEVVQSYTGAEKKTVQKVDRAKAHNRDFYKRPVAVASAGGAATAGGAAGNVTYNTTASYTSYQSTTNVFTDAGSAASTAAATNAASSVLTSAAKAVGDAGSNMSAGMAAGVAAAAAGVAAAGGGAAGAVLAGKAKKNPESAE